MSQQVLFIPQTPPDPGAQRHLRHELALNSLPGSAQSLSVGQGTLLGVVPVGAGCRLAIVGYILPPRRPAGPAPDLARPAPQPHDGLVVDAAQHRVLVNQRDIGLVYREFELLAFLAARPCRAFTRADLLASVWGSAYQGSTRTVDVHVHRLRRKLGPEFGERLVTMRHLGYLYRPPSAATTPGSAETRG
jgi:DNA-binding winged helix-turn-helix (wHTH) protein